MAKNKKLFAPPTEEELKQVDMFAPPTEEELKEPDLSKQIETGARSFVETPSLSLTEPLISGANAVIANLIDAGYDADTAKEFVKKAIDPHAIKALYEKDVERRKSLKQELPGIDIGAQIGGALVPAGPASMLFKGAKAVTAGKAGEGLVKTGLRKAAEGAIGGAGAVGTQNVIEGSTGFGESEASPMEAGALGAGLQALPVAGKLAGKGLKAGAKLGLGAVTGVSPKVQTAALERPELLFGEAKPIELIKNEMDQALEAVHQKASLDKANLTDDVLGGIQELKTKVSEGSGQAISLLENRGEQLSLVSPKKAVSDAINSLKILGKTPVGEASKTSLSRLEQLQKDLDVLGDSISLDQAKKLIQQLDSDISYAQRAGQYTDQVDRAYQKVRQGIDNSIKTLVPEYGEKMKEVAENTRLLKEVSQKFGDPNRLFSKVDRLEADANQLDRLLIDKLGAKTGRNYGTYFDNLTETYKPLASLKPQSTENAIKSILKGNSIETRKLIEHLSKVSDQEFLQMIDQLRLQEAFNKPFQIGSRNVNLWTVIGAASGGAMGDFALAAPGAAFGALIDRYGPATTKKILQGVSKIDGLPTVKKIKELDIPEEAKQYLSESLLKATLVNYRTGEGIKVPEHAIKDMEKEIIASKGLTMKEKAKNLNSLYSEGVVFDADKLITDRPLEKKALPLHPKLPSKKEQMKNASSFAIQKKPEDL